MSPLLSALLPQPLHTLAQHIQNKSRAVDKTVSALSMRGKATLTRRTLTLVQSNKTRMVAHIDHSAFHVPIFSHKHDSHFDLQSVSLHADSAAGASSILFETDDDCFDYQQLLEHACLIVDTRGRLPSSRAVLAAV